MTVAGSLHQWRLPAAADLRRRSWQRCTPGAGDGNDAQEVGCSGDALSSSPPKEYESCGSRLLEVCMCGLSGTMQLGACPFPQRFHTLTRCSLLTSNVRGHIGAYRTELFRAALLARQTSSSTLY